jgi:predicted RNA-binding Zn-ribbon protein involved in translation (DUF1610 family)
MGILYFESYCPNCMSTTNSQFCTVCGTKVVAGMDHMPTCKGCGAMVADQIRKIGKKYAHCPNCGLSTSDIVVTPILPPTKPVRRSFLARILGW